MKFSDYFLLTRARLLGNKRKTFYSILVVAFSTVLMMVLSSVCMGFICESFAEMKSMSVLFSFYVNIKDNSLHRLVSVIIILTMVAASVINFAHFFIETGARKKEQKNKLIMGATYANIIIEAVIENLISLLIGLVIGGVISLAINVFLGLVLEITIMFNTHIFMMLCAVQVGVMLFSTIVPSVWVSVDK